jgi:hypothetical protein
MRNDWGAVWKLTKSGDFFFLNRKYYEIVNCTLRYDRDITLFVGAVGEVGVYRADIFLAIYSVLNVRAAMHVIYYTAIYEMMNNLRDENEVAKNS